MEHAYCSVGNWLFRVCLICMGTNWKTSLFCFFVSMYLDLHGMFLGFEGVLEQFLEKGTFSGCRGGGGGMFETYDWNLNFWGKRPLFKILGMCMVLRSLILPLHALPRHKCQGLAMVRLNNDNEPTLKKFDLDSRFNGSLLSVKQLPRYSLSFVYMPDVSLMTYSLDN
jgi:hypothetical protein